MQRIHFVQISCDYAQFNRERLYLLTCVPSLFTFDTPPH